MKQDKLLEIFSMIDDDFITEAKRTAKRQQLSKRIGLASLAATIVILCLWLIPKEASPPCESVQLESQTSSIPFPTVPSITEPSPTVPSAPASQERPPIPSNVPGTIVLNQKIASTSPLQGCVGNIYDTQYSGFSEEIPIFGVTVTAKPIEIIDGVFTYLDDRFHRNYRVIRMQTIECHFGTGMPDEFYLLYENYLDPDFLEYDSIIMNELAPLGYENQILLNIENNEFQAFEYILFHTYHIAGIKDGICIGSLGEHESYWGINEDEIVNEFVRTMGNTEISKVKTTSTISNSVALEAIRWVEPFRNGVYIQQLDYYTIFTKNYSATYRRMINGYPTNETVQIYENGANYSTQVFTEKDIANMPDLPSALHAINKAFDEGKIQPPHLVINESLPLTKHTIHGWYAKSDDEVFGIIRVGWCYGDIWDGPYLDDKYYLIEKDSDKIIPLEAKELISILEDGATDFIFTGKYNENGMVYPLMPVC